MDPTTLGAAMTLARSIPDTAANKAIDAARRAETAAQSVKESLEAIKEFENTGITVIDGRLCVKVERS